MITAVISVAKFMQTLHSCSLIESAWIVIDRFGSLWLVLGRYGLFWLVLA